MTIRTILTAAALTLGCVGLTACTGDSKTGKTGKDGKGGGAAKEEPKAGFDSPEDCYKRMVELHAQDEFDMEEFVKVMAPPFRKEVSGMMVLMAGFIIDKDKKEPAMKALDELCKEQKIKKPEGKVNLAKANEAIDPMMKDVEDTTACCVAVMNWIMDHSSEMKKKLKNQKDVGELKDLETEGDYAMGKGKVKKTDGKEIDRTHYFHKVDGRWYKTDTKAAKDTFRKKKDGAKKTG